MCTTPITKDGVTFACGGCNACVATKRRSWIARAMAEKAMHPETLCVTLTYADDTQFRRDGAAMFRYADVRLFLASLRRQIEYHTGQTGLVRFLCAGEQGSRNGRCHWHIILFSEVDLTTVGEFSDHGRKCTERSDIVSPEDSKEILRRSWTMWPHGYVAVQEPDEFGMSYVLAYAVKDQFSAKKSQSTMREHKAEAFATGMFRMSKYPPIGQQYLDERIYSLYERGAVLPDLRLSVDGLGGYWWPSGLSRLTLLAGMRRINNSVLAQCGQNAPQWRSLLQSCRESETDLEVLLHGEKRQEETEESDDFAFAKSVRVREGEAANQRIRRRCGAVLPCTPCLRGNEAAVLAASGVTENTDPETGYACFSYAPPQGGREHGVGYWQSSATGRLNPLCLLRDTSRVKKIFSSQQP